MAPESAKLHRTIGQNIRRQRLTIGLRQSDVAARMNYSLCAVNQWECGIRRISIDSLYRIAQVLHTTPQDLLP